MAKLNFSLKIASQSFHPHLRFRLPQSLCQQSVFLQNVLKVVSLRSRPCACDSWWGLCPDLGSSRDEELLVACLQSHGTHALSGQQSYLMMNLQSAKKMLEIRPHLSAGIQLWCKWEWFTPSPSPPFSMRLPAGGGLRQCDCDLGEYYSPCSGQLHVFPPGNTTGPEQQWESLQKFGKA